MLLSSPRLHQLIDENVIDALHENVNSASIDIRIGNEILVEAPAWQYQDLSGMAEAVPGVHAEPIDIAAKQSIKWDKVKIGDEGIVIYPGQVFLANTREFFNLPADISATFVLKSSIARNFLNHMLAGYADAGWNGSTLTMEFKNESMFHPLLIKKGMRIGQMVFHKHNDTGEMSYGLKGNYNGQKTVTAAYGNK